ncbi:MAG: alpha/beta fold hydrolase [Acidobacteriota bacterium]|nr:alpha/beta fold hydrolase [Acidobacteriota bacterium]
MTRILSPNTSSLCHFPKGLSFHPPFWLRGAFQQTLFGSVVSRDFSWGWKHFQEHFIDLECGTCVRLAGIWKNPSLPTVVVLHGTGGSRNSTYMKGLSHKAYREGWNAVLPDLYNTNQFVESPKVFHSGSSREVEAVLQQVVERYRVEEMYLVGVSMGGNILLKLLGEWGSSCPDQVRSAAVISPLVDLNASWKVLEKSSNYIFQHHMVTNLKKRVQKDLPNLDRFVDQKAWSRIRTFRQFDDLYTAPLAGFSDALDYYDKASALPYLKDICLPTLLIHALDDPLLPADPFVSSEVCSNPSLCVVLTQQGGHVGFVEKRGRNGQDRFWAENRVIDFFRFVSEALN